VERVAFLIERSGERVECLLNPETFTITRQAGIRPYRTLSGALTGTAEADNPLLATGGGVTELVLELLFDVSKQLNAGPDDSVQTLTAPLWEMAENSDVANNGYGGPPMIRFVWGKSWNIPAIVVSVAERFEQFTPAGIPRRSWVKMRLLRCTATPGAPDRRVVPAGDAVAPLPQDVAPEDVQTHEVQGDRSGPDGEGLVERIDQLAHRYYGDASRWTVLAAFNNLDDPSRLPAGASLMVPPLTSSRA
jgi:Contractile injection system tube protein